MLRRQRVLHARITLSSAEDRHPGAAQDIGGLHEPAAAVVARHAQHQRRKRIHTHLRHMQKERT
eukprot:7379190-Prymnesium_polylepis.2